MDSSTVVARTWHRWADRHGLDAESILQVAYGRRTHETLQVVAPQLDVSSEVAWLDAAELADLDGVKAVPGATELVATLSPNHWAVVTSAGRNLALRRLARAGLPTPDHLIPGEVVEHGKPAPDGYLLAAAELCVTPEDCVVIEDAPAGILAAKAAGMRAIGLTTTHTAGQLAEADVVLTDLTTIRVNVRKKDLLLEAGY